MEQKVDKTIVIRDFYGEGDHVYASDLGWQELQKDEASSLVSREIFEFEIVRTGYNMSFYYLDNDTFYGIHTERLPIEVKILPRDRTQPFIGWQCECDTHDDGEVIYSFDDASKIWDNVRIDGKSLEEVIERSYIVNFN